MLNKIKKNLKIEIVLPNKFFILNSFSKHNLSTLMIFLKFTTFMIRVQICIFMIKEVEI